MYSLAPKVSPDPGRAQILKQMRCLEFGNHFVRDADGRVAVFRLDREPAVTRYQKENQGQGTQLEEGHKRYQHKHDDSGPAQANVGV